MPLPFLASSKQKQESGISTVYQGPGISPPQDDSEAGVLACAADLAKAIEAHDIKGMAEALKAIFAICDAQPHVEGRHE